MELVSVKEAADLLNVSTTTIYSLMKESKFPNQVNPSKGITQFRKSDIMEYDGGTNTSSGRKILKHFYIEPEQAEWLEQQKKERNMYQAEILRDLIQHEMDKRD